MSTTKAIQIRGRTAWSLDNAHDVVLALVVEAAERKLGVDESLLRDWRVWASIQDLAFAWDGPVPEAVWELMLAAREAVEASGDVRQDDLEAWSVLDGQQVSGGFLRWDPLPVDCLLDTLDGIVEMLGDELAADPADGWWCFGFPGGRAVLSRRPDEPED